MLVLSTQNIPVGTSGHVRSFHPTITRLLVSLIPVGFRPGFSRRIRFSLFFHLKRPSTHLCIGITIKALHNSLDQIRLLTHAVACGLIQFRGLLQNYSLLPIRIFRFCQTPPLNCIHVGLYFVTLTRTNSDWLRDLSCGEEMSELHTGNSETRIKNRRRQPSEYELLINSIG